KGSISPDVLSIGRSVDALVMVLLGGVQAVTGPIVGAVAFTWQQDSLARETQYWRALLGGIILLLVLLFPAGIAGAIRARLMPAEGERWSRPAVRRCSRWPACARPSAESSRSTTSASASRPARSSR